MGKYVQRPGGNQLRRQRQIVCLLFRLAAHDLVQILQGGRRNGVVGTHIVLVHLGQTAAHDGTHLRGHVAAAHQLVEHRQHKLGLFGQRPVVLAVVPVHIQQVDVNIGRGRHCNDLAAKGTNQRDIFRLRVQNENIIVGAHHNLADGVLAGGGFSAAGRRQNPAVAVEQCGAVRHDDVVADRVLAVIQPARHDDFLRMERQHDGGAFGGEGAHRQNLARAIGQGGVQALQLLERQRRQLAELLAGHRLHLFGGCVQLFEAVGGEDHRQQAKDQPLVAGGQVAQHLFGFGALLFHVKGNHGREVVGGVLAALPGGDVCFHPQQPVLNFTHRFVGGNRQQVQRDHHLTGQLVQFRNELIFDEIGVVLQIQRPHIQVVQLEEAGLDLHRLGAEPVLEMVAAPHGSGKVEGGGGRLTGFVEIPQKRQPVGPVQRRGLRG